MITNQHICVSPVQRETLNVLIRLDVANLILSLRWRTHNVTSKRFDLMAEIWQLISEPDNQNVWNSDVNLRTLS